MFTNHLILNIQKTSLDFPLERAVVFPTLINSTTIHLIVHSQIQVLSLISLSPTLTIISKISTFKISPKSSHFHQLSFSLSHHHLLAEVLPQISNLSLATSLPLPASLALCSSSIPSSSCLKTSTCVLPPAWNVSTTRCYHDLPLTSGLC